MAQSTLEVSHLNTSFFTECGEVKAVQDVSVSVGKGQVVGIVGESGCGKSMIARSIMGLIKKPGKIVSGSIVLEGTELTSLSERELCKVRGKDVSMVFQEPMTSLNPTMRVGRQVQEVIAIHESLPKDEARRRTLEMLSAVGIPEVEARYRAYPHELSGGLRQRVMIAMAMVMRPRLLIADEPTTALDATVETQIIALLKQLAKDGTSVLIISHNLGVIAQLADYVYVMYAGRIVEKGSVFELFDNPLHPYTHGLLGAVSSLRSQSKVLQTIPGVVPNLAHLPAGCSFAPRCKECMARCGSNQPRLMAVNSEHEVCCHLIEGADSL